jgi:hypothetical protein
MKTIKAGRNGRKMHLILWLAGTEARYQKTVKQIIYTPNI